MAKDRSVRRHHEERIRERFRNVAKRWAGKYDNWVNKWFFTPDGVMHHYLDRTGFVKRMQFIETTIRRLAHHNKCPCGMCKRERYRREKFDPHEELKKDTE